MKNLFCLYILAIVIITACSADDSSNAVNDTSTLANDKPEPALLIFPNKNSVCTEGKDFTEVSNTVEFIWESGENTDAFEIVLTNLDENNSVRKFKTKETKFNITKLIRGNRYKWQIIAINNNTKKQTVSKEWNFYNAGAPVVFYAPFAAEILSPEDKSEVNTTKINLSWKAKDLDNDIKSYDLFLGTKNPPSFFETGLKSPEKKGINILLGTTYYWRIITNDGRENSSISSVFSFVTK